MKRALREALEASEKGRQYLANEKAARASRSRRTAGKRAPGRAAKKAKRDAHAADTAEIRARALLRAGSVAELCGRPLGEDAELCHLDGGSGKRRQRQSIENCLMEHHECHQGPLGLDKKPLAWLPAVKAWCERHGYPLPERFRKLEILRTRPSVPVRVEVKEGA